MITEAQLTLQCVRWQSYIISPIMACSATASLKTNIKAITGNICHRQCCCSNHSDLCSNALLEMCTSSVMGHYTECAAVNYYGFIQIECIFIKAYLWWSSAWTCDRKLIDMPRWALYSIFVWNTGPIHLESGKSNMKCQKGCSVTLI